MPIFQADSASMHKLAALIVTFAGGLALPFVHPAKPLTRPGVEQALRERENSGPNGHVTSRVHCATVGRNRYSCWLVSVRHTKLEARVIVHGRTLQVGWAPLSG
jgi:hypothetical protein